MKLKKSIIPFLAGITAGAAAGYYLNSPKGKKQIKKVKKSVKEVESNVSQTVDQKLTQYKTELQDMITTIQTQLDEVKATGASTLENGKVMLTDVSEQGLDKTIELADKLKQRAEEAKANINLS